MGACEWWRVLLGRRRGRGEEVGDWGGLLNFRAAAGVLFLEGEKQEQSAEHGDEEAYEDLEFEPLDTPCQRRVRAPEEEIAEECEEVGQVSLGSFAGVRRK